MCSCSSSFTAINTRRWCNSNVSTDGRGREAGGYRRRGVPIEHLEEGRFVLLLQEGQPTVSS